MASKRRKRIVPDDDIPETENQLRGWKAGPEGATAGSRPGHEAWARPAKVATENGGFRSGSMQTRLLLTKRLVKAGNRGSTTFSHVKFPSGRLNGNDQRQLRTVAFLTRGSAL